MLDPYQSNECLQCVAETQMRFMSSIHCDTKENEALGRALAIPVTIITSIQDFGGSLVACLEATGKGFYNISQVFVGDTDSALKGLKQLFFKAPVFIIRAIVLPIFRAISLSIELLAKPNYSLQESQFLIESQVYDENSNVRRLFDSKGIVLSQLSDWCMKFQGYPTAAARLLETVDLTFAYRHANGNTEDLDRHRTWLEEANERQLKLLEEIRSSRIHLAATSLFNLYVNN